MIASDFVVPGSECREAGPSLLLGRPQRSQVSGGGHAGNGNSSRTRPLTPPSGVRYKSSNRFASGVGSRHKQRLASTMPPLSTDPNAPPQSKYSVPTSSSTCPKRKYSYGHGRRSWWSILPPGLPMGKYSCSRATACQSSGKRLGAVMRVSPERSDSQLPARLDRDRFQDRGYMQGA